MSRNFFGLTLSVCAFFALATASSATVITIADWQFAPGGLTTDSGPNGYTLTNVGGVTQGTDGSPATNEPASGNYALFSGTDYLQTAAAISLSSYTNLTLTWSMYLNQTSDSYIIAGGTGSTPLYQVGDALWVKANDTLGTAPGGLAGVSDGGNPNLKNYSTASGASPNQQWDSYKAVIDLNAIGAACK